MNKRQKKKQFKKFQIALLKNLAFHYQVPYRFLGIKEKQKY